MKLHELITHAQEGRIESLDLVSIEGGIYLLNAHMDGRIHGLHDECDKAMRLRSVEHARYLLEQAPDVPLYLVHASAYDEMCGLSEGRREPLRLLTSMRSQWGS